MSFIKAVGKAFGLTHRLLFGIVVVLLFTAALSALATMLLPFEVVEGQSIQIPATIHGTPQPVTVKSNTPLLRVPPPKNWQEAKAILVPALVLFLFSSIGFLFLLGATLGSVRKLLHNEPVSPMEYLRSGARWFFPILGWVSLLGVLVLCVSFLFGIPLAIRAGGLADQDQVKKAIAMFGLVFMSVHLVAFLIFLFSPVSLVERGRGSWDSLGDSFRFFFKNLLGTIGLLASAVGVGVILTVVGIVLAGVVNSLRAMFGILPFSKGWPVFFFTSILALPQAYLTVYFPVLLYTYYNGKQTQ